MTLSDIIFAFANIINLFSLSVRKMLWLRSLSIVGSILFISAGLLLNNKSLIIWSFFYIAMNMIRIILLIMEKKPYLLPEKLKSIYLQSFPHMTTRNFYKLFEAGSMITAHEPTVLIEENIISDKVVLIIKGQAQVIVQDKILCILEPGNFIGEMSYITQDPTCARVTSQKQLTYIVWDKKTLEKLKTKKHELFKDFEQAIGGNLVKKIRENNHLILQAS